MTGLSQGPLVSAVVPPEGSTRVAGLRLLVASDVRLLADSLVERLGTVPDVAVVAVAHSRAELLEWADALVPHVTLVDMTMPESLDALTDLARRQHDSRVIAIGIPETEEVLVPCIAAGIHGYVPRGGTLEDLLAVVQAVSSGGTICSPEITASLFRRLRDSQLEPTAPSGDTPLTARETEVAKLLENGVSNKRIAQDLGIGVATVKKHVHRILGKLGVLRRSQVAIALRERSRRRWGLFHPGYQRMPTGPTTTAPREGGVPTP